LLKQFSSIINPTHIFSHFENVFHAKVKHLFTERLIFKFLPTYLNEVCNEVIHRQQRILKICHFTFVLLPTFANIWICFLDPRSLS